MSKAADTTHTRLRIIIGCEFSGTVRDAFRRLGHDAWSCDLLPCETEGPHIQGDVREVLGDKWDLGIFHPPCKYLSVSGLHWNNRGRGWSETKKALAFVRLLLKADIPHIALENPISLISSKIRKPDQIIQPYEFGHDASKKTCLWLKNLPLLEPTKIIAPRMVNGKPRWGNQSDSGQSNIPESKDRWKLKSITYPGIASAMALTWSQAIIKSMKS